MLLAIGLAGLVIVAVTRLRRAALGWVAFACVLWSLYGLWGYPILNPDRSSLDVMREARAAGGPERTVGLVAWKEQNLLMIQGPVTVFGFSEPWDTQYAAALKWMAADPAQRRIFIRQAAMGDCVRRSRATFLGRANDYAWWLVGPAAVVPGCHPDQHDSD
jgi:hypothetical protein